MDQQQHDAIQQPIVEALRLIRRSDSITQLVTALSAAQGEMKHPVKDKTAKVPTKSGNAYEYKYSDLANLLDATRAPFAKHGLCMVQIPTTSHFGCAVTTLLAHKSGEWIEATLSMPIADDRPQTLGSVITYLRRYSAGPMAGLSSEDDDDANVAQQHEERGGYKETPRDNNRGGGGGKGRTHERHPAPPVDDAPPPDDDAPPQQGRGAPAADTKRTPPRAPANQPDRPELDPKQPYDHGEVTHRRQLARMCKLAWNVDDDYKLNADQTEIIRKCGRALAAERVPMGSIESAVREWGRITKWGQVEAPTTRAEDGA